MYVTNPAGQNVYKTFIKKAKPGMNKLTIDANGLTPGIYFYTVKAGEAFVTKKMIVE